LDYEMKDNSPRYNILTEPTISVVLKESSEIAPYSLPEVYELLCNNSVERFPRLRHHQRIPFHCFLVQLAAMSIHTNNGILPSSSTEWREVLRALTRGYPDDEPWCLCIEDYSRPAFFQPPIPGELLKSEAIQAADELDILVTAKNHDLKSSRMYLAQPEDWLFALMTLQTQEGNLGRGNYGIARMNGGYGSRPFVGIQPKDGIGRRFRNDLTIAIRSRQEIIEATEIGFKERDGICLTWLEPWDGKTSLPTSSLDPFFIEVCRIIRLQTSPMGLRALRGNTETKRIDPSVNRGHVGDLWSPIKETKDGPACFGISKRGFHYTTIVDILFHNSKNPIHPPYSVRFFEANPEQIEPSLLQFVALCRGQGKTEGFYDRSIPLPLKARTLLFSKETGIPQQIAHERIRTISSVQGALRISLKRLFSRSPEKIDLSPLSESRISQVVDKFDQETDRCFFDDFWEEVLASDESNRDQIRLGWIDKLTGRARELVNETSKQVQEGNLYRYRQRALALRQLDRELNKLNLQPQRGLSNG
jgi:CRISPR system Cascade subunit CasA